MTLRWEAPVTARVPASIEVPEDLLSIKQLTARRPATEEQVSWLRQTGQLRTFKVGRRVYISLADYDALVSVIEPKTGAA